ncbi:hypothetical protein N866_19845 [Actinotalea ferrariae CF5-4]|uniref:Uridine kinase n=1 Tax=Actinotalea ferrariae CF5-4 TaxID=948458 RepID=A0A021VR00_9CELL|nr:hypothetical protein N866_19845 [Actinotalea ferrariae CF5-4]
MGAVTLPPGEPELGPWRTVPLRDLLDVVRAEAGDPVGRPRVVAVDGRGASGKTTLSARLQRLVPRSAVVHVDDLSWNEPLYEWGHLLAEDVLEPLHAGRALSFRPPQWGVHGRPGAIEVPAGLDLVVVEGTGASHAEHAGLVDATVWVQADFALAEVRGIARDVEQGVNGDLAEATAFWHEWMVAELAFFERQRPWERACVAVNGSPSGALREDEVQLAAVRPA